MAASIEHTTLGKIQGKSSDGVTQYLGIKYGHLKDRFAEATMAEPTGTTDATKIGSVVLPRLLCARAISVPDLY